MLAFILFKFAELTITYHLELSILFKLKDAVHIILCDKSEYVLLFTTVKTNVSPNLRDHISCFGAIFVVEIDSIAWDSEINLLSLSLFNNNLVFCEIEV